VRAKWMARGTRSIPLPSHRDAVMVAEGFNPRRTLPLSEPCERAVGCSLSLSQFSIRLPHSSFIVPHSSFCLHRSSDPCHEA
jgi:hypothetical protein